MDDRPRRRVRGLWHRHARLLASIGAFRARVIARCLDLHLHRLHARPGQPLRPHCRDELRPVDVARRARARQLPRATPGKALDCAARCLRRARSARGRPPLGVESRHRRRYLLLGRVLASAAHRPAVASARHNRRGGGDTPVDRARRGPVAPRSQLPARVRTGERHLRPFRQWVVVLARPDIAVRSVPRRRQRQLRTSELRRLLQPSRIELCRRHNAARCGLCSGDAGAAPAAWRQACRGLVRPHRRRRDSLGRRGHAAGTLPGVAAVIRGPATPEPQLCPRRPCPLGPARRVRRLPRVHGSNSSVGARSRAGRRPRSHTRRAPGRARAGGGRGVPRCSRPMSRATGSST